MILGLMKKTMIRTNVLRKRGNSHLLIQDDVYSNILIYIIFTLTYNVNLSLISIINKTYYIKKMLMHDLYDYSIVFVTIIIKKGLYKKPRCF